MQDAPQITMIMCTRNRAEQLRRVLESAAAMHIPNGLDWEFLLIDNGSTDHTAEVTNSFVGRLPIRHVFEPIAGLSNARNRGVAEATGRYICWTDDDVVIDRMWLSAYADAFARHPDAAFFGGPIQLMLEVESPSWFEENRADLGSLLAEREFGDQEIALDPDNKLMPFGANYAVRNAEQRLHSYDPQLGVSPQQRRLGEESTVLYAIWHAGGKGWWVPGARVQHMIPAHRQTISYVKEYQRSAGETWAYLGSLGGHNVMGRSIEPPRRTIQGAPILLWRWTLKHWLLYRYHRIASASPHWIEHLRWYSFYMGAVNYWRGQRRQG